MQRFLIDARILILLVLFVHGAVGCSDDAGAKKSEGAQADSTKTDSTGVAEKDDKKKVREGVPVKVSAVGTGEISEHVLYSATVEAEATIDIYSQASGLVRVIRVEEGAKVTKGHVLVELVDDELKLDVAEALLAYQKIDAQLRRKAELYNRKLLAKDEYEDLRMSVAQSKIRWERAQLSLDHAHVKAPVDGVIAQRLVKIGDRVGQSSKLFEMVNLSRLIAYVHVPGQGMQNLTLGQRAMVTTDFLPGSKFEGRILRISPVVDPSSGTFKVTLELAADDRRLRPGMFVSAHIVTATHARAVLVPKRAVVYDDGMAHVFVVTDSTAKKVRFGIGFDDTDYVEVISGVEKGDMIVIVGQNGLKDQAKVRIIDGEGLRIPAKPDSNVATTDPEST
jgi:membrane fusion protein (multidrug efflux system)